MSPILVKSSFRWSPCTFFRKLKIDKRLFQNHNVFFFLKIQCEIDFLWTRCSLVTFCSIHWQMWHVLYHCWKHFYFYFPYYVGFFIYIHMGSFSSFFARCVWFYAHKLFISFSSIWYNKYVITWGNVIIYNLFKLYDYKSSLNIFVVLIHMWSILTSRVTNTFQFENSV